jgi:NAD(P)-dependent dehydrogenase (short-subunit alcohol dehydrogenase family)
MVAFVGAVEEISDWNFREQLEVNFFGTANIIRCVLPGMRRRRSGHIINITGLSISTPEGIVG